ncbi:MAG: CoA transferase [Chloroflexi bacterium]|nr:CoA transferase [Chloroflexota bacterium]
MPSLDGIRVIALTGERGAYCAKLLADLGADVFDVEPPGGSEERRLPPLMHSDPSVSLHFLHFHRGRKSVVLDRETPEGYDTFERLVESADVLIEDESSPSLDHDALRAVNPGLLHARITGFGASGPRAHWKSSDLVAQAAGSLMYRMGFPEDPPNSMGEGFAHHQTSAHAAAGILLALARRDATGEGGFVDVSLQEGIALMQYDVMPMYVTHKTLIKRAGHGQGSSGKRYRRIWECNPGLVRFQLLSQSSDREWPLLLDWLESHGHSEGLRDERWLDPAARTAGLAELEPLLDRFFRTMDARTLMHEAQDRGIMLMAFNSVGELTTDPQLADEGFFRKIALPVPSFPRKRESTPHDGTTLTDAGPPYRFAGGLREGAPAPALGEGSGPLSLRPSLSFPPPSPSFPRKRESSVPPLEGLRICDFTWVIAGPLHTKWLAAYGAEVIKIERFKKGAALNRGNMSPDSVVSFNNLNVGKRSLALDMSFQEARDAIVRLVERSDIVVDNFGPDVLPNWGFTPERLAEINPRIITLSMPALGKTGPHRLYKGLGSYFQARAALDGLIGYSHRDITDVGFAYADTTCNAGHALVALLAALHRRNVTGQGEHIELRQLESTINFLGPALLEYEANGEEPARTGSRSRHLAPQGVYRCDGDDQWCALTVASNDEWAALCRLIGRDAWADDDRFADAPRRMARHDEIDEAIEAWTTQHGPQDAAEALQAAGVAASPVLHAGQLIDDDPQMASRGFYRRFPDGGVVESAPFILSDAEPYFPSASAPEYGEGTRYVLSEVIGLDDTTVTQMFESGAAGE